MILYISMILKTNNLKSYQVALSVGIIPTPPCHLFPRYYKTISLLSPYLTSPIPICWPQTPSLALPCQDTRLDAKTAVFQHHWSTHTHLPCRFGQLSTCQTWWPHLCWTKCILHWKRCWQDASHQHCKGIIVMEGHTKKFTKVLLFIPSIGTLGGLSGQKENNSQTNWIEVGLRQTAVLALLAIYGWSLLKQFRTGWILSLAQQCPVLHWSRNGNEDPWHHSTNPKQLDFACFLDVWWKTRM